MKEVFVLCPYRYGEAAYGTIKSTVREDDAAQVPKYLGDKFSIFLHAPVRKCTWNMGFPPGDTGIRQTSIFLYSPPVSIALACSGVFLHFI